MRLLIREAQPEELERVHAVMREAFEEYRGLLVPESGALRETVDDIAAKIRSGGGAVLAWLGDQTVGSAQYACREGYLYIGRVAVLPASRSAGIGKELLAYLERKAAVLGLSETRVGVRLSIPENVAYYRKKGYIVLEKHDYPDRTDSWYIMRKEVTGSGAAE